jgi:hypothetical protein
VEQPAGHGAVQLGRSHVALVVGNIMNPIDEGRAPAAVAWRVGRNLGGPATVSNGGSNLADSRWVEYVTPADKTVGAKTNLQ